MTRTPYLESEPEQLARADAAPTKPFVYRYTQSKVMPTPHRDTEVSEAVMAVVVKAYNVSRELILDHNRHPAATDARQVCMYLIYDGGRRSFTSVGKLLGRDRTTAMNGVRKVRRGAKADRKLRRLLLGMADQVIVETSLRMAAHGGER